MNFITIIWLSILWTIFWSFGSVILQRMQRKISWKVVKWFLFGRSECPKCHHQLHRYNLIPLYSWFSQGGKCMYCKTKISSLYPVLEIVSGLVFALRWWIYLLPYLDGLGELSLIMLVFWRLLWLLLVRDIYTYELHVPVWFITVVLMVIHTIVLVIQWEWSWYLFIASMTLLWLFFAIYWFGKRYAKARFGKTEETFGQGDVMLAPLLWYLFALEHIGQTDLISLVLFFVLGSCMVGLIYYALTSIVMKIQKRKNTDHIHATGSPMIPFLPSMIIAYWGIVIWTMMMSY